VAVPEHQSSAAVQRYTAGRRHQEVFIDRKLHVQVLKQTSTPHQGVPLHGNVLTCQ
jgi:hypothetical protein